MRKIPPLDGDLLHPSSRYGGFYDTGFHYTERLDGLSPGSVCKVCFDNLGLSAGRWPTDKVYGVLNLTEPDQDA